MESADLSESGRSSTGRRFVRVVRSIVDADPAAIEAATRQLGGSRQWLAPVAWATGTLVLLVTGVKLLVLNWRLSLIQLIPAVWIWLATWDLKRHLLKGKDFGHVPVGVLVLISLGIVVFSTAAYWCNTVFALAIDGPRPPRVRPAIRRAAEYRRTILRWGLTVGGCLVVATVVIPRTGRLWLFSGVLAVVIAVMLISFVAVPARIIGARKLKTPPKEAVAGAAAGAALSGVAMGPGFLLDRIGLVLLGVSGAHAVGFILLSIGTALYAAGMCSVKAVKLSGRFTAGGGTQTEP